MLKKIALLIVLFSFQTFGQTSIQCQSSEPNCVPVGEWHFSVALGAGVYTNPLHGGKHIPLVLIPYVSYYDEKFFIENTTIGYTLLDQAGWNISLVGQLNHEQAFFERWHPNNIFVASAHSSFINGEIAADNVERTIDVQDVSHRDWAYDSGLLINWYLTSKSQLTLEVLHDISNVYQGAHATIDYRYRTTFGFIKKSKLELATGISWKSSQLTNYYYGLSEKDTDDSLLHYRANAAWSPYIGLAFNKRLSKDWQLKVNIKREFLSNSITNSPLIRKNHVDTVFLGVKYVY